MKKLLLILVIAGVGVYMFQPGLFDSMFRKGAFDEQGNPLTLLFTMEQCGSYCDDARTILKQSKIPFEEFSVSTEEGRERLESLGGGRTLPVTIVGDQRLDGYHKQGMKSILGEAYGLNIYNRLERQVMKTHFDAQGKPRLVMYGTTWCPGCKEAREYFKENNIEYTELDAEKSSKGKKNYAILQGGGYPLIYVGHRFLPGFDKKKINTAIDELMI